MNHHNLLRTGQTSCYTEAGGVIPCPETGQDGEFRIGSPWPTPRFVTSGGEVLDRLTGLIWMKDANPNGFPVPWREAIDLIAIMNEDDFLGARDWRLPNRRELRSLMDYQARKPSLPDGHPFVNIFSGWYWTSTTAAINPAYAWYVHMEGARMFYGKKDGYCLFWPVRGDGGANLPQTGQTLCYDEAGGVIPCPGTGQDGELRRGAPWPVPRFVSGEQFVHDQLTGLYWARNADITGRPVSWQDSLDAVRRLNDTRFAGFDRWRLPNINELESLVDCASHSPALPEGHPFSGLREGYWSSTTSFFETDWAWVLYLEKGACGVGHKPGRTFFAWPVHG